MHNPRRLLFLPLLLLAASLLVACSSDSDAANDSTPTPSPIVDDGGASGTRPEGTVGDWDDTPNGSLPPPDSQLPPSSEDEPALPPTDLPAPPSATILLPNGEKLIAGTGSSCWTELNGPGICIDKIGIITNGDVVTLSNGASLILNNGLDSDSIRSVVASAYPAAGTPSELDTGELAWPFPGNTSVELEPQVSIAGIGLDLELEPGAWIVSVFLSAPQGDVSYGIYVSVE